jgi:hypothetical protein
MLITFAFIKPLSTIDFRMIPSKTSKHLSWFWLDFPWYVTIIWLFFLYLPMCLNKLWFLFAFCLSAILYSYIMFAHDKTWGSIWCWIANSIAIYFIYKVFMKDFCTI